MYNKKVLIDSLKKLGSAKAPTQKKDIIIDPRGQWAHPGENTRIPGNDITMDNVPYPVYAVPNVGPSRMMYPEQEYNFPGADYVDEYPQVNSEIPKAQLGKIISNVTRSNNIISRPIKKIGYNIATQSSLPYRRKDQILKGILGTSKGQYFGENYNHLNIYGPAKRDLNKLYFFGDETGFLPVNYDFSSDSGLNAMMEKYGPLKAFLLNSELQHGAPLDAGELNWYMPSSIMSNNNYDKDILKNNFNNLFEKNESDIIPFEVHPFDQSKSKFFLLSNPIKPIDNIAGHMAFLKRTPDKEFELTTRDLWGFRPEAYNEKWNMYTKFKKAQTQLMDVFGKPFVLTQTNPIKFKKGGSTPKLPKKKNSRAYSRSLEATNRFFAEHSFFAKPKSRKNKIDDPNAKYYQDGGDTDAMNAMMKARLAYANQFGNPGAQRMIVAPDQPYDFGDGNYGTHYMASMDNYAVPQIQNVNGQLVLGDFGPSSTEAIRFDRPEDAEYFAEHYKDVSPAFIETELSPEEIEQYAKGGYIIEDVSTPSLTKMQTAGIVKGAKNLLRGANIATIGTANTLAKTFAPIMANPIHIPTVGFLTGERTMIGPFTGSPLNIIPGYGKNLKKEMSGDEAFRYFGDNLDYVKLNNNILDSAHGPLLRVGKNRVLSDKGQWFEEGTPNASYTSVFGVRANPYHPESNLQYMPSGSRNGVLIGDMSTANPRIINANDPGLTFYRRLPFSQNVSEVNIDNPWDWKNYGGNLQSLAERYGYAAAYAAALAGVGTTEPQEYLDKYITNPIKKGYKKVEEFFENPFMFRPEPKRKKGGIPKAQLGRVIKTGRDISKLLKPTSEFRNTLSSLDELGNLPGVAPIMRTMSKPSKLIKTDVPKNDLEKYLNEASGHSLIKFGDEAHPGNEWYYIDPEDYRGLDWKKESLKDASNSLNKYMSGLPRYGKDIFKEVGDFEFKDFSDGWKARQAMMNMTSEPQKILGEKDFFTENELLDLINKQNEWQAARNAFNDMEPWDPKTAMISIFNRDNSREELFSNLFPNVSIPNFRSKFTTPSQEALLQQHIPWQYSLRNQGMLNPNSLKNINTIGDTLPKTYQDLLKSQKNNWFAVAPARDVVMEMRGVLGLKIEDIKNATPEQFEKWRQQVVKKMNKQALDRWNRDVEKPFKGSDAWKEISNQPGYKNQFGGLAKSSGNALRSLLYRGINPANYNVLEKVKYFPNELYKTAKYNETRPFRVGHDLKVLPEEFNMYLKTKGITPKEYAKMPDSEKMTLYSETTRNLLEDVGKRRLDAWAVGLKQPQEYGTLEQVGDNTFRMKDLNYTPEFFSERWNDLRAQELKDKDYYFDDEDPLVTLTKQHYNRGLHPYLAGMLGVKEPNQVTQDAIASLSKMNQSQIDKALGLPERDFTPWTQTRHAGLNKLNPDPSFTHSIFDSDQYGVMGGYRWDLANQPEGIHWQANDVWDINPFERRLSTHINPDKLRLKYLESSYFKPLQNFEALSAVGGRPFNIQNNFLVDPKSFKVLKSWQKGGQIDYELGDEVDEATMKQLMKLGYTFEKI